MDKIGGYDLQVRGLFMAVKDKKLLATYGQATLDAGFLSIPNHLLEHQEELNITDRELMFFIKVSYFFKKQYIRDIDLKMDSCPRTIKNIRKNLIKKGYLKVDVLYEKKEDGKIVGIGTKYDWTGLIEAMNKIPCKREKEKIDGKIIDLSETIEPRGKICTSAPRGKFCQAEENFSPARQNLPLHKVVKERTVKERTVKEGSSNKPESTKSDKMSETKQSELEKHVESVKEWYESPGIRGIFRDDLKPLWRKLYPKLDIDQEVEKAYTSLLTHPSGLKNYSAYFQACIYNAAIGRFPPAKNQDSRQDECLKWYISHHPYGYSFNSEEDERRYIARVLSFIDQYPGKSERWFESFKKICEQYWKLDTSLHPKFEYLEKSNWRLRHLPDAINYIISLNRSQKAKTKAKAEYLCDLAPSKPGRYFASRDGTKEIFEVNVYSENGKLMTEYGPVDQLKWKWSIVVIDSS